MEPVYYGYLGTNPECLAGFLGVLIFQVIIAIMYDYEPFGTITKHLAMWIMQMSIFQVS